MSGTRLLAAALVLGIAGGGGAGCAPAGSSAAAVNGLENTALPALDFPGGERSGSARADARVFISGHSLIDWPFPDYLAQLGESLGTPVQWNAQYVGGSSILARTRGVDAPPGSWQGYRTGRNRQGENMDVVQEWRQPATIDAPAYDTLLITENHLLLAAVIWSDTVRLLRHYHDQFIGANPAGSTYFYQPWLSLDSKDDPARWIRYEREAAPVWQCVVTRINVSLAHEGRTDRIVTIPAGLALAELIARATGPEGLPGITQHSTRATVDLLINDDVHTTPAGYYFVTLVSYATVFRQSPVGATVPDDIPPAVGRALQEFAWHFVRDHFATYHPPTLNECAAAARAFNATYWRYVRTQYFIPEVGWLRGTARWAKVRWQVARQLSRQDASNPFHFDPATDGAYWTGAGSQ